MVSVLRFVDFTKESKHSEQILTQEFNGTEGQKRYELNKDADTVSKKCVSFDKNSRGEFLRGAKSKWSGARLAKGDLV